MRFMPACPLWNFVNCGGLRAIVRLATAGQPVVLHGLAAQLQSVLGILGWDGTPGLVIDNKPSGLQLARR